MARFYFHVWDGDDCEPDTHGVDLAGMGAARRRATQIARELFVNDVKRGRTQVSRRVVIEDEDGKTSMMPFSLSIKGMPADGLEDELVSLAFG